MAKGHKFNQVSLWIANKVIPLHNQKARLRFELEYTVKHDGAAASTDYQSMFDLEMPVVRLLELAKNSLAIVLQNKHLRKLDEHNGAKWVKDHSPITYDALFPGRTSVVVKQMSDAEVKERAAKDPEFRKALIEYLMNMDSDDSEE